MRKKKWKRSRAILPLLLSAIMIVEPVGMANTVYAEELAPITETIDSEQDSAVDTEENEQEKNDDVKDDAEGNVDDQGEGEDDKKDEGSASDNEDENTESPENPSVAEGGEGQETDQDGEDEELPDDETLGEEEDAEAEEDTVSGNDLEEEEEKSDDALNGFWGMPSSYKLSSEQMESKKSLSAHMNEISGFEAGTNYVKGEVVTLVESREEAEMIAKAYNAEIADFDWGVLTLKLNPDVPVEMALKVAADMDTNMPAVWPNYYRYLLEEEPVSGSSTPENSDGIEIEMTEYDAEESQAPAEEVSDTSYLKVVTDEYLNPRSQYYQWHHTVIGSPYAWTAGYTGNNVKVAVLDSGVEANSDLPTIQTFSGNSGTSDSQGHGTHVAGIIGARANGNLGVGVAPDVTLYSYNLGNITSDDIMKGINAARAAGVDIINMSVGGLGFIEYEQTCVNNAYDAGIAIFASAGNDGGQTYSYPACYNHVISVAATDKNNERASFSSYSNMVDLSAPGVAIYSTSRTGGYVSMSGTSMACPVAAGEAAVILSSGKISTAGGKRVDDLERLMKQNTIRAGSGMGSGITSLTKVFGLSTAATKPKTPEIKIVPDDTAKAQRVDVTITAPSGIKIYYTTNGKNPAFKNGEVDTKAETQEYTAAFSINNVAKATVKAIAVNESGVSSAVKSVSYTLKPYVTSIAISGLTKVAPGKSIQLSATVTPAYAANKQLTWTLQNSNGTELTDEEKTNLKVASNGKVTATARAKPGTYQVVVKAKDRGDASVSSAPYSITVIDGVIVKSVKFIDNDNKVLKNITLTRPTTSTYNLWDNLLAEEVTAGTTLTANDFKWTSSNDTIASVSALGVVTPNEAGKATITALAADSSGKKATVTVTVIQLSTGLAIKAPATAKSDGTVIAKIAPGKNATFQAVFTPATTTNKKVTWEIYDANNEKIDAKTNKELAQKAGVSIAANGKVSATRTAQSGVYTIRVIAQDSSKKAEAKIQVTDGIISKLTFPVRTDANVKIFRKRTGYSDDIYNFGQKSVKIKAKIEGAGADLTQYTVSNSNPGIAGITDLSTATEKENGNITLQITATEKAAGKTKITIASTDGSNQKLICNVTVVNPVSAITIAPAAGNNGCLVPGKSLQLKARVESENGVISNKGVLWTIFRGKVQNNTVVDWVDVESTDGIKLSTSGKVTVDKNAKTAEVYMVQAAAKDGSGVFDQYIITVEKAATQLDVYQGQYPSASKVKPSAKYRLQMIQEGYVVYCDVTSNLQQGGFTVSSSNPAVVSVSYSAYKDSGGNSYVGYGRLAVATHKKGTATITVKAMDGSGKQVKWTFLVY